MMIFLSITIKYLKLCKLLFCYSFIIFKMKNLLSKKLFFLVYVLVFAISFQGCYVEGGSEHYVELETYSEYFTIYKNSWIPTSEVGHWYYSINMSSITSAVVDRGAVFVYYRNNDNNWVLLPYSTTFYYNGIQYSEEIWSGFARGRVDIDYVYTHPMDISPRDLYLKIVVFRD